MKVDLLTTTDKLKIKAVANKWMSDNLNGEKKYLSSNTPEHDFVNQLWKVDLIAKKFNKIIGNVQMDNNLNIVKHTRYQTISNRLSRLLSSDPSIGGGGVQQNPYP